MIDAFPFRSWLTEGGDVNQDLTAFWPFAPGGSTGTWVLTIIGMIVTVLAIIAWVYMDDRMLREHAERLRAAGFGREGAARPPEPGS